MVGSGSRLGRRPVLLTVLLGVLLVACSDGEEDEYAAAESSGAQTVQVAVPDLSDVAGQGSELFGASCSECHGPTAGGTSQGPPLVHRIYEPGHHSDFSFVRAVDVGSPQHHWSFGDMEPVAGLSPEDREQDHLLRAGTPVRQRDLHRSGRLDRLRSLSLDQKVKVPDMVVVPSTEASTRAVVRRVSASMRSRHPG